jgi:hypothetical protein
MAQGGPEQEYQMQLAIAKATVGNANTPHLAIIELGEGNKFSTFGLSCGSRIRNAQIFVSEVLTRSVDMVTEKYWSLYPEAIEKISATDIVCEKCYSRAVE